MCEKKQRLHTQSQSRDHTVTSQTYGDARLELHKSTPYLAQAGRLGRGPIHIRLYLAALDRCIYTYARVHTEARSAYRLSIAFFLHTQTPPYITLCTLHRGLCTLSQSSRKGRAPSIRMFIPPMSSGHRAPSTMQDVHTAKKVGLENFVERSIFV